MSVTRYTSGSFLLLRQFLQSRRERIVPGLVGDIDNSLHPAPHPLDPTGLPGVQIENIDR
jgi:hypothetical protein